MATKAELEDVYNRYQHSIALVASVEVERDYAGVLQLAEASLPLVHNAVTFQRRVLKADRMVAPTVDCLLRYAPPLFMRRSLDAVEKWYSSGTRTERNSLPELLDRLDEARHLLGRAIELWSTLSQTPRATLRLENLPTREAELIQVWLHSGFVERKNWAGTTEFRRVSDPRRSVWGKCCQCGSAQEAALSCFLDPLSCPFCGQQSEHVIIQRVE